MYAHTCPYSIETDAAHITGHRSQKLTPIEEEKITLRFYLAQNHLCIFFIL